MKYKKIILRLCFYITILIIPTLVLLSYKEEPILFILTRSVPLEIMVLIISYCFFEEGFYVEPTEEQKTAQKNYWAKKEREEERYQAFLDEVHRSWNSDENKKNRDDHNSSNDWVE